MKALIAFIVLVIVVFTLWKKDQVQKQRRQQSKCQLCGKDLGSELIVLEKLYESYGLGKSRFVKQLFYRGDEARKRIEPEQPTQCPTCGATDIKYAYIEDGSMGYWCYQCKKSLKAMEDASYQQKADFYFQRYTICPSCAVTETQDDMPNPEPASTLIFFLIISVVFSLTFISALYYLIKIYDPASFQAYNTKEHNKVREKDVRVIHEDRRFAAYNNGIVLDKKTGLEWYVGPDSDTTWNEAKSCIENLNRDEFLDGYWKMPTILELKTIYQDGVGRRNMTPLLKTTGWWVWSSEEKQGGLNRLLSSSLHFRKCTEEWRPQVDSSFYGRAFAVRSKKEINHGPGSTKEVATHSEIPKGKGVKSMFDH